MRVCNSPGVFPRTLTFKLLCMFRVGSKREMQGVYLSKVAMNFSQV